MNDCRHARTAAEFFTAIPFVFEKTPCSERALRDGVLLSVQVYWHVLSRYPAFKDVVDRTSEFSADVLKLILPSRVAPRRLLEGGR